MSGKELRRAGVLARVKSGELKLVNAAVMMGLNYRQSKRLAKRYQEGGAKGWQHGSAGSELNRRKPKKFRERVLPGGQEIFGNGVAISEEKKLSIKGTDDAEVLLFDLV